MGKIFDKYRFLFLGLSIGYYVVFFGVVRLFDRHLLWAKAGPERQFGFLYEGIHPGSTLTVIIGVSVFAIMYLIALWLVRAFTPSDGGRFSIPSQYYVVAVFILFAQAAMIGFDARPPVAYQIISNLKFFAILLIRHNQITGEASRLLFWLGAIAIFVILGAEANMTLLTSFAMSILCLLSIEFLHRRRLWIVFLIIGIATVIVHPIKRSGLPKSVFAECAEQRPAPGAAYFIKVWPMCKDTESRVRLVAATLSWTIKPLIRRISTDMAFDRVYRETPKIVPYWEGRSLRPLLYVLVPRFLIPDKPKEIIGQEFGHLYKITDTGDHSTSINVPWIVDLYINFSTKGVVFGMAIIGALLGVITSLGTIFRGRPEVGFLAMGLTFPLVYPESNISMMFGNALHGTVGGILIMLLIWGLKRFRILTP